MTIFKRIGAMLTIMVIMVSCMVPTFADTTKKTGDLAKSINEVGAKIETTGGNKDNGTNGMQLTINGITNAGEQASVWEKIFTEYRGVIVGLSGIGAITMIVFFIINFMKLGASAGNPQQRTQALVGIIWTGLAAAGLGGVTIFVGFFYNIFNGTAEGGT